MTKCYRICGAYLFRLSRKHSTVLLIALFILSITVILHLFVYKKHHGHPSALRIGDFDYRPASFLKNKQPNDNQSYCHFNYGLPTTLKWNEVKIFTPPETGKNSSYRVIYNAIQATYYENKSSYEAVTYATQATPEFIYHIVEIARYWEGPISLAVFVPNYDLDVTMQIMNQLCRCYAGMSKISLHLFYPKKYPPRIRRPRKIATTEIPNSSTTQNIDDILRVKRERYRRVNDMQSRSEYIQWVRRKRIHMMMARTLKKYPETTVSFVDCSGPENFDVPTFRRENNMKYPINVGRNVARMASRTNYFVVSDIELVPSDGLATKFLTMVRKLMGDKKRDGGRIFVKTVFVVPLFEVERGEAIPRDKDTLVRMVSENRAKYFHQKVCSHCQRFPGLQSWLSRPAPAVAEPMLIARREYPYHRWEPIYFGTQNEPWYSEALTWEGRQDKMTQMLEMCLQQYHMVVLDGGFLCHAATTRLNATHNRQEESNNHRKYLNIIAAFKHKYKDRPKCKVK
ncbi:uncharacterized protein LOC121726477 [Aricia agestis]|uniref:uncharacterized protein LOC121726477 n=1 Tax=Aricia agestis TaxID=91739 RepID=UPI001C208CA2|nr:uncharacterized protein LOC121726477 [Aricia agestis]